MKKYKAILVEFDDGETNGEVMDLINVNDKTDKIMAAPHEFEAGEIVTEDDIFIEEANYVDDQGVGSADFAFKKFK